MAKTFNIHWSITLVEKGTVQVEAKDEDEAIEIVKNMIDEGSEQLVPRSIERLPEDDYVELDN